MAFSTPTVPINDPSRRFESDTELIKSVTDLIFNGPYLNSRYTNAFELEFANFVGVEHCIAVSSGTAALELAIKALELPSNSVILMTANAGGYSAVAAKNAGFRTRYVDVDDFGLLCLDNLNQNLKDVSAIVITHLYGQMCDMNALVSFASQNNLRVIEDCAQAVGSSIGSIPAGSFGDLSAFSFYPTKNLGGIGDSGAVCTRSQGLADRLRHLREYGWSERYFSVVSGGGNFRNDEIQSLVLINQLTTLKAKNDIRKEIWIRYYEICNLYGVQILGNSTNDFVPHLAVLKISKRKEFIKHMNERNIRVDIHYPFPDFLQPGIIVEEERKLIQTSLHCNQVVSIPLFPEMTETEICRVEEGLREFFGKVHD